MIDCAHLNRRRAMLHFDHAVLAVRELDRAAATYRRLGFTLTSRGGHPKLGTANHTIMMGRTYLELLTVVEPRAENARWQDTLAAGEQLASIAYGSRDASQTRTTLLSRGIEASELLDFSRPVSLDGTTVDARFTITQLPDAATPALPGFVCQHHTPEYVWRSEWQRHANTATEVVAITLVHPDPAEISGAYDRLLGRASVHPHPGGIALDLLGTMIWIVSPAYAAHRLGRPVGTPGRAHGVGLTVAVRDLDAARRWLDSQSVPHAPFGRRSILIPEVATHGINLELLAA